MFTMMGLGAVGSSFSSAPPYMGVVMVMHGGWSGSTFSVIDAVVVVEPSSTVSATTYWPETRTFRHCRVGSVTVGQGTSAAVEPSGAWSMRHAFTSGSPSASLDAAPLSWNIEYAG